MDANDPKKRFESVGLGEASHPREAAEGSRYLSVPEGIRAARYVSSEYRHGDVRITILTVYM